MGSQPTKTVKFVESNSEKGQQILRKYSDILPPATQPQVTTLQRNTLDHSAIAECSQHREQPLPLPKPCRKKKNEIFQGEKFSEIDKLSREFDIMKMNDWDEFNTYMKSISNTELELVRALFSWIASIDFSNLENKVEDLPEGGTPLDYMLKIQWNMGNHAYFLAMCCRMNSGGKHLQQLNGVKGKGIARRRVKLLLHIFVREREGEREKEEALNISCKIINGINKSAAYQLEDMPINRRLLTAQWNAVLINDEWRLIDILWASTCVIGKTNKSWTLIKENEDNEIDEEEADKEPETFHRVNEFFFITDPEKLVYTHLPDIPQWQLLSKPITETQFAETFYVRERYFELNMTNETTNRVIRSKTGDINITFYVEDSDHAEKNINFKFLLYRKADDNENDEFQNLENFIFYSKVKNKRIFQIKFPIKGTFKLDIFGTDKSRHEGYDLACSYLIINDKPLKVEPLPDIPEIGWGIGIEAKEKGIEAKSHQSPIIETSDGKVELRFNLAKSLSVLQNLRSNSLDELLLSKHTLLRTEGDEMIVSLRLPTGGDYALKLFADGEGSEGDLPNVCNYLIKCLKADEECEAFPKMHEGAVGKSHLASKLGVVALDNSPIVKPTDGKLSVDFQVNDEELEIFAELTSNNYQPGDLFNLIDKRIDNSGKITTFDIDLPGKGEFALNVFAKKKSTGNKLYHIHTYLIDNESSKGSLPLNQSIPIFSSEIFKDTLDICLPANRVPVYAEFQRKNAQGFDNENFSVQLNGKNNLFHLEFPENGEYKMDVYKGDGIKRLQQICTYQFWKRDPYPDELNPIQEAEEGETSEKETEKVLPGVYESKKQVIESKEPKGNEEEESTENKTEVAEKTEEQKALEEEQRKRMEQIKAIEREHAKWRELLKQAMNKEDPHQISTAMKNFRQHKVTDKLGLLNKAQQLFDYLTITEELSYAMGKRDLSKLKLIIKKAQGSSVSKKLNLQIKMAQRIEGQLEKLEKLRHAVMTLNQKTIAELKSYNSPPEPAHLSMIATFLLLGEKESILKKWGNIVALMGKTGKLSLKRRVQEANVENFSYPDCRRARDYIKNLELNQVRDVSSAAATFFVWSKGMIEEAESRSEQSGNDFSRTTSSMGVKR
ncbi:DgyrCDS13412 [Dimorphilus gyrociliatus]|uniref:DgyrCDS13412 n=1 Tax=Dimorphilus gyrociliatus TaxID=2664684 RepID=A0A7I8WAL1_9ANNE|nr:DgyrCDS13412 [Dimorphilus gyrociliatus]